MALVPFLAAAGARLDGLRLLDGTLIVKIERHGRAVQVRVANDGPLLAGGGFLLYDGPGEDLSMTMARLAALRSVLGGPALSARVGAVGEERELLMALALNRAKVASQRELASAWWGLAEVGKHWAHDRLDARPGPLPAEGGGGDRAAAQRWDCVDAAPLPPAVKSEPRGNPARDALRYPTERRVRISTTSACRSRL